MYRPILLVACAAPLLAQSLSDTYRETANRLIDAALADQGGYDKLSYLCDRIGNRLAGSPSLDKAIAWAAGQMKKDGLENVVTPRVKAPHWVRGRRARLSNRSPGLSPCWAWVGASRLQRRASRRR